MNQFQRYLLDEFVDDYKSGEMSRRDFVMKVAMPPAPGTYAGVVVIHENRGLLEHHKDIARRYAKAGFAAVAPDLVARAGGADNADPDQVPGFLSTADPQRHVDDATDAWARAVAWFREYLPAG